MSVLKSTVTHRFMRDQDGDSVTRVGKLSGPEHYSRARVALACMVALWVAVPQIAYPAEVARQLKFATTCRQFFGVVESELVNVGNDLEISIGKPQLTDGDRRAGADILGMSREYLELVTALDELTYIYFVMGDEVDKGVVIRYLQRKIDYFHARRTQYEPRIKLAVEHAHSPAIQAAGRKVNSEMLRVDQFLDTLGVRVTPKRGDKK